MRRRERADWMVAVTAGVVPERVSWVGVLMLAREQVWGGPREVEMRWLSWPEKRGKE